MPEFLLGFCFGVLLPPLAFLLLALWRGAWDLRDEGRSVRWDRE